MDADFVDLYELQLQVREGLEDLFPGRVWVRAEISAIQAKAGGHCYLELSQSGPDGVVAKAKAIIWRSRYAMLSAFFREATGSPLKAGITLLFRVQVTYSELYGLSLIVDEIDPNYTLGESELRRQRTIARLQEEGLLDLQKEIPMPVLPYKLAVISARDAAGFGDFSKHLSGNEYGFVFHADLFEAAMQGDTAPESIASALSCVDDSYDAVLILRGGGSVLDLACFDDYALCKAIATFPIPVFTAVGHERDVHVADLVAYESVKTPTALADLFIDAFAAEDERISSLASRVRLATAHFLAGQQAKLDGMAAGVRQAVAGKVALQLSRLDALRDRIAAADPAAVLSRGYSLVTDAGGVVLKSVSGLHAGDTVRLFFSDGEATASLVKVENDGKPTI